MKQLIPTLLVFLLTIFVPPDVIAANTTMYVSPQSGSFGKEFKASIILDGRGERFNAANAKLTLSNNLTITGLTLGDCNFSFLNTPTKELPSFEGIILSSYATKCTAYTISVAPNAIGKAKIDLSDASVKQYGDAKEILKSVKSSSYELTALAAKQSGKKEGAGTKSEKGLYSVLIKVLSSEAPDPSVNVLLSTSEKKNMQTNKTNKNGEAEFNNLREGIYDVVVEKEGKKVGETIINVAGQSKLLTFNINLDTQKNNPLMKNNNTFLNKVLESPIFLAAILVVGLVIGIVVTVAGLKIIEKKKKVK